MNRGTCEILAYLKTKLKYDIPIGILVSAVDLRDLVWKFRGSSADGVGYNHIELTSHDHGRSEFEIGE